MKKIISCDLPLPIQRLYIKRLKHMIMRWEYKGICAYCPVNTYFKSGNKKIQTFHNKYRRTICAFCEKNMGSEFLCPCGALKPQEALKRAKDFIKRFEAACKDKPASKGGNK